MAIAIVPILGLFGLGVEGSNWLLTYRAAQNAADSAVVAAANQALQDYYLTCGGGSCTWPTGTSTNTAAFQQEGLGVASKFNFVSGTNNATVTVAPNGTAVTCPSTVSSTLAATMGCFKVTVSQAVPLSFSRVLGFNGNTTVNSAPAVLINASAIAGPVTEPGNICLLALGTDSNGYKQYALDFHGSSGVNLQGCPVGSNGGMFCSGNSTLNSPYGVAGDGSTDKNGTCGDQATTQAAAIVDPYASLAADIPANTCGGSYPGTTSASVSSTSGTTKAAATIIVCGNLTLSANFNITGDETIVIENGYLDLHGYNFTTSGTGGVTVIFTSPNYASASTIVGNDSGGGETGGEGYIYDSTGGGGIDISSPPTGSGNFAGVTIYQDPTPWGPPDSSKQQSYSSTWDGNSSKMGWSLSGVYYLPNANLVLNGATDKASNGYNCFDMVVNAITSNGGNGFSMFANPLSQCGQQGSNLPEVPGYRYALVG